MNTTGTIFLLILLPFLFTSCKDSDSFIKHDSGFEYKIISKNNAGNIIEKDNILDLDLKYFTQNDSLIFNSEELPGKFRVMIFGSGEGGLFQDALKLLKIGDSAQFLIPASDFYKNTIYTSLPVFIKEGENLKINLKINKVVLQEELDKEYDQYILKMETEENLLLQEYLKNENITVKPTESGLYIILLNKGKGRKVQKGDKVTVHYQGTLINGQIFDSSIDRGEPIKFVIGEGNVIPAWEEAILNRRKGEKIKLITPSKQAYGEYGYEKIIPPFATLIFEIKLVDIQ